MGNVSMFANIFSALGAVFYLLMLIILIRIFMREKNRYTNVQLDIVYFILGVILLLPVIMMFARITIEFTNGNSTVYPYTMLLFNQLAQFAEVMLISLLVFLVRTKSRIAKIFFAGLASLIMFSYLILIASNHAIEF